MTHLLLTVRWLDGRYHGLLSRDGPPEWPPSPFRLFQALVSGVARRGELDSVLGESLGGYKNSTRRRSSRRARRPDRLSHTLFPITTAIRSQIDKTDSKGRHFAPPSCSTSR